MTVTVSIPTATSIKLRFPEFADEDNAIIEFAIEEARLGVNETWTKGYDVAIMYLAAHYVACDINRRAQGGSGDAGDIASESWGRFSISYAKSANTNATAEDKSSTSYGRRYEELRNANFGGPVII